MHRKSKKWVNLGILVFLGILFLVGVVKGISGMVKDDRSNSFFAVTKHDEDYTMETGTREGYTTKDLTMLGVTEPFSFPEHAGEVKITFQTKYQYEHFLRDIGEKSAWRDAYEFYKEKGKSSN